MRINDGIGSVVRGPDGSLRPANDLMLLRDGRLTVWSDKAAWVSRPTGLYVPEQRLVDWARTDSYAVQEGHTFNHPTVHNPEISLLHTEAYIQPQRSSTRTCKRNVVLVELSADLARVPDQDQGQEVLLGPQAWTIWRDYLKWTCRGFRYRWYVRSWTPGPGRASLPPQIPPMMNNVCGPRPGPAGPVAMARRPTLMQGRPLPIGMGVVRMLELSQELSNMKDKMLPDWVRFRGEFFTQSGSISMTIFYGVEGRKYMVAPELIPRYFLAFFESGVNKMSIGLNGATETTEGCQNEQLESYVSTMHAVWRYELDNGWVVEHNGPLKVHLVAEQVPGDPQSFKLKINNMVCNAPTTSYFFRPERIDGNLLHGPNHDVGPMTPGYPRASQHATGEPMGGPGVGLGDDHGAFLEHEERIMYEKASLPPKPFQTYGLPGSRLVRDSRPAGSSFPHFNPSFNPSHMPNHSPALVHAQAGMHHGPPQGAIPTTGRPTPTPPPMRQGGGPGIGRGGMPLAGSGELPPVPGLGVAIPSGMIMSQSPLLTHPGAPGQQPNVQLGLKRKQQAEQGPDPMSGPSNPQPPRGMPNSTNQNRFNKSSPVGGRKKAKTNPSTLS
ncbi:Formin-like protein 5 [Rhizoctonia solani]|uniref:Formin-like protein 5 n=1 Tax=Rhizoctonia solani TaxID=456999 RepID=A0A8H8SRV6_9AGAM|nr:Formin-like protein 5 [Rhizoctonia solani]QRW15954.1 Formin-like protein 5 [Rhizoctonia solani]